MKFTDYVPINADSLLNLIKVKGANSCSIITQFFKDALLEKAGNENITLRELYTRFGITFRIGATNITTSRFELLEHTSHPDLPVYLAIKASIAVPFVFEPVIIGEYLYCDGGLLENLPVETVADEFNNPIPIPDDNNPDDNNPDDNNPDNNNPDDNNPDDNKIKTKIPIDEKLKSLIYTIQVCMKIIEKEENTELVEIIKLYY